MCIAIYKPENVKIEKEVLEICFNNHPHGAGFVAHHAKTNTLSLQKGYFDFDDFWKNIKNKMHNKMIIHFRWATHGEKNKINCHPFMINKNLVMAHNGQLKEVRNWDKAMSDTWHFIETIIKPLLKLKPDIWQSDIIQEMLSGFIGKGNKLIFMNNFGKVVILNESLGQWEGEGNDELKKCWYSNLTFKAPKKVVIIDHTKGATSTPSSQTGNSKFDWRAGSNTSALSDARLVGYYANRERTVDELLLEELFMKCEEAELAGEPEIQKVQKELDALINKRNSTEGKAITPQDVKVSEYVDGYAEVFCPVCEQPYPEKWKNWLHVVNNYVCDRCYADIVESGAEDEVSIEEEELYCWGTPPDNCQRCSLYVGEGGVSLDGKTELFYNEEEELWLCEECHGLMQESNIKEDAIKQSEKILREIDNDGKIELPELPLTHVPSKLNKADELLLSELSPALRDLTKKELECVVSEKS